MFLVPLARNNSEDLKERWLASFYYFFFKLLFWECAGCVLGILGFTLRRTAVAATSHVGQSDAGNESRDDAFGAPPEWHVTLARRWIGSDSLYSVRCGPSLGRN